MAKRIIVIVLLLALALFAYVGYNTYDTRRTGTSGEVYSNGVARTAATDNRATPSDADTVVYPSAADTQAANQQPAASQAAQPTAAASPSSTALITRSQQQPPAGTVPATDTISPNPPNGMTFAGSGRYQLYRQGNITWRLDTETGRSCIIFATDEEWRKPRVYRAGCGKG
ncbi:MAG: hypothetical protein JST61_01395 [Acidobacteria bacterium]|nr:hypothetical protein [Acidobacteriota bacterium]